MLSGGLITVDLLTSGKSEALSRYTTKAEFNLTSSALFGFIEAAVRGLATADYSEVLVHVF